MLWQALQQLPQSLVGPFSTQHPPSGKLPGPPSGRGMQPTSQWKFPAGGAAPPGGSGPLTQANPGQHPVPWGHWAPGPRQHMPSQVAVGYPQH
jgi:hypothetical protein